MMETVQRANEDINYCDFKHQCLIFIFLPAILRHLVSITRAANLPVDSFYSPNPDLNYIKGRRLTLDVISRGESDFSQSGLLWSP